MSLRAFHIIFVVVTTLLCLFLVAWSFFLAPAGMVGASKIGIAGIIGAVLMPIYGVYFYNKVKHFTL